MQKTVVRRLALEEVSLWRSFRLDMLQASPQNFGSSYEEEQEWSQETFLEKFKSSAVFGVFIEGMLVSSAAFFIMEGPKNQHKGYLWAVYTKPSYRGKGLATQALKAVLEYARTCVRQVYLSCNVGNQEAYALYLKQGFKAYGRDPCSLKVGDQFFDEDLMVLMF